jgi:FkbM family methyltransferase
LAPRRGHVAALADVTGSIRPVPAARGYVDRMRTPRGRATADLALTLAPNPVLDAGGDPVAARQVRDLLAPALGDEPGGGPSVDVLDIGANPIDGDPPYQLMLDAGLCRVTGFEPQPAALAELRRRAGPHERYLPYAVGDGGQHTLHLCATSGFASLLAPDERQLELLIDFPRLAQVVGHEQVNTHRLDDLVEIDSVDLLKIDIQGGELFVLRAGRRTLASTVAVQTEVGFHRLYRDQPTFADVDLELRSMGLVPHQFVSTRTWPIAPVGWGDPLQAAARQLVEADVLYVRDPVRLHDVQDGQLARLALICDTVYGSFGLALRCVLELIGRGSLDPVAERDYRYLANLRLTTAAR